MFTRFAVAVALMGALLSCAVCPSRADTASDIKALQAAVKTPQGQVSTLQTQNASLQSQVNSLKSVTSGFSRVTDTTRTDGKKGTELYLTGFNLHVVNGVGDTANPNGLGNVIIGYNTSRGTDSSGKSLDVRTGSHNLVLGIGQNYSSFEGVVFGAFNAVSAPYTSVIGGVYNTASGELSSITGGFNNTASGTYSSVTGGDTNVAIGFYSSIAGGYQNTAGGQHAVITGGNANTASGEYSSVSGGYQNTAGGLYAAVSSGKHNQANADYSAVSGGQFNTVTGTGTYAIIGGGLNVLETTSSGFAAGGQYSGSNPGPGVFHSP